MTLLAFHGDAAIKAKYLARVRAHRAADEIRQGFYWKNGKGCAVGCTIHGDEHRRYETELGIPRAIARIKDRIFERLTNKEAKEFPVQFHEAIPVGADLSMVMPRFLLWLLGRVRRHAKGAKAKKAIGAVIALYKRKLRGDEPTREEWRKASDAAWSAKRAASAADMEAWAASRAASRAASWAAAWAAAGEAADASAAAEAAAATKATKTAYQSFAAEMRDKLLELLREAPVPEVA